MTRILTYNVHGCVGTDRRLDVARVADVIAAARPDIVALQELDVGRARSGGVDQAHAIAARLGMAVHFNAAVRVAEERYGDAILTPWPMRLVRSGALPSLHRAARLEPRGALWVEVEVAGRALQVVNTHLGLVPLEQREQVRCLLGSGWLGAPGFADPAILLGDFNATSRYGAYKALAARLDDAQRRLQGEGRLGRALRTFPARLPVLRIDHVFVSPGVRVSGVEVPAGPLARLASDHRPLAVDVELG